MHKQHASRAAHSPLSLKDRAACDLCRNDSGDNNMEDSADEDIED